MKATLARKRGLLSLHQRYSPERFLEVMQPGYKIVTSLRDPLERFKSAYFFLRSNLEPINVHVQKYVDKWCG